MSKNPMMELHTKIIEGKLSKAEAVQMLRKIEEEFWIDPEKMTLTENGELNPNALINLDQAETSSWKVLEDAEDGLPHSPSDVLNAGHRMAFCGMVRMILSLK